MKTKNEEKFVTYRIIFVPDIQLSERTVKLARKIVKNKKIYFVINKEKYYPHLTVYKAEFPLKNRKAIFEGLKEFSKYQKPFVLNFNGFYSEWGWLGIDFKKTREVYDAHKRILELMNPLREGHIREKFFNELKTNKYSVAQKKNVVKYGYPLVLSEYHPHLTLTRFIDVKEAMKMENYYNSQKVDFGGGVITSIAVVSGGEHGTVTKYIRKYKLLG